MLSVLAILSRMMTDVFLFYFGAMLYRVCGRHSRINGLINEFSYQIQWTSSFTFMETVSIETISMETVSMETITMEPIAMEIPNKTYLPIVIWWVCEDDWKVEVLMCV